jgi:hypothetical protein
VSAAIFLFIALQESLDMEADFTAAQACGGVPGRHALANQVRSAGLHSLFSHQFPDMYVS